MNVVSRLVSVGCSVVVTFGLISKMIQIIRFINIHYPPRLQNIFKTWSTDVLNLVIPKQIDSKIVSHDINSVFTTYGVEPSFLSNFWGMMVTILVAAAFWVLCKAFLCLLEQCQTRRKTLIYTVLQKFSKGALNFLVVSIYGGFSDVVFYTILEMKSLVFGSSWSGISFALSVLFLLLGLCLISIHWTFLLRYQSLQSKSSTASRLALEELTRKYEVIAVLYEDLSDTSLFKHGFLFIGVARDTIISLIIATLTSRPLFQAVLLTCCSILMCIYLMFNNPFRDRFEQASQIFLELCVFVVYISMSTLAVLDSDKISATEDRERLGLVIINVNIIINSGCAFLLGIKMLQQIWVAYKSYSEKKSRMVHVQSHVPPNLNPNNNDRANIEQREANMLANSTLLRDDISNSNSSQIRLQQSEKGFQFLDESISSNNKTCINKNKTSVFGRVILTVPDKNDRALQRIQASSAISQASSSVSPLSRPKNVRKHGAALCRNGELKLPNKNTK